MQSLGYFWKSLRDRERILDIEQFYLIKIPGFYQGKEKNHVT